MKKIDINKIVLMPEKIIALSKEINELLDELAKKEIIELEDDE